MLFRSQLAVVEALKKDLNKPDLKTKYNLVTSQTRIPLIQNGTADLECGSTTNNAERAQQVDFTVNIFEIGTRLLVKKDKDGKPSYADFADLKGKNVVTTAGTTSERHGYAKAMQTQIDHGIFDYCGARVASSHLLLDSESRDPRPHLDLARNLGLELFVQAPASAAHAH